jgi:hypothetical protein
MTRRGAGGIPRQERKRKTKSTGESSAGGAAIAAFREAARSLLRRARAVRIVNHVREFLFSSFNFD